MTFPRLSPARRIAFISTLLVAVVAMIVQMVSGSVLSAQATTATPSIYYMDPSGGSNTSCTQAQPCATLMAALAAATDGSTIIANGGAYGDQTVTGLKRSQSAKTVTVTSATGQQAIFGTTLLSQPGTTFQNVSFDGTVRLNPAADHTTLDTVHVFGPNATVLVRTSYVTVVQSLIEDGYPHDGINIAGNPPVHDVSVSRTTIRDFEGGPPGAEHPDCVQIFDAHDISLTQNDFYDCYNSAITFSKGANLGISNVTIRSNFLQGCIPARQRCGNGGSSVDLRQTVTNVVVDHNTFGPQSLRMPYQPGVTATNNIVSFLSVYPCDTALTNSLVGGFTSMCKGGLPGSANGNTLGSPAFVDQANGDLHLAGAAADAMATRAVAGASVAPDGVDIDGDPMTTADLGADAPSNGVSAPAFNGLPSFATVGQTVPVTATTGAGSPAASVWVDPASSGCALSGSTLSFQHVGTCIVWASSDGSTTGPTTASQSIMVSAATPGLSLSLPNNTIALGSTTVATAVLSSNLPGAVQFLIDGQPTGTPQELVSGSALSPALTASAGRHEVTATFVPTTPADAASATSSAAVLTVKRAASHVKVAVSGTRLSVAVAPLDAIAGVVDVTGPVSVHLNGLALTPTNLQNGKADLSLDPPVGHTSTLVVGFAGSDDLMPATATAKVAVQAVRQSLSSSKAPAGGWYRGPVTVRVSCMLDGRAVYTGCPGSHVITRQGATTITRYVNGVVAGTQTVKVDSVAPTIKITGLRAGHRYAVRPHPRCVASDGTSGVRACTVRTVVHGTRGVTTVTAVDNAGNVAHRTIRFIVRKHG